LYSQGTGVSTVKKKNGNSDSQEADHRLQDLNSSNCALYFINEGFPYVSIMDGGYGAAFEWLQQNFPSLESSVVIKHINKSSSSLDLANDRPTRTVQTLLDRSMVALTLGEQKIEESLSKFFASKGGTAAKKG